MASVHSGCRGRNKRNDHMPSMHCQKPSLKPVYRSKLSRQWHVVNETLTEAPGSQGVHVLCGQIFTSRDGERGSCQATCVTCRKLDNPLLLSRLMINLLEYYYEEHNPTFRRVAPGRMHDAAWRALTCRDYINSDGTATRRGTLISEDFRAMPVPLADAHGLMHLRWPLWPLSRCNPHTMLLGIETMSTAHYAKLRLLSEPISVTCLACHAL